MIIKYLMYYYYIIHICYLDINLSSNKFTLTLDSIIEIIINRIII